MKKGIKAGFHMRLFKTDIDFKFLIGEHQGECKELPEVVHEPHKELIEDKIVENNEKLTEEVTTPKKESPILSYPRSPWTENQKLPKVNDFSAAVVTKKEKKKKKLMGEDEIMLDRIRQGRDKWNQWKKDHDDRFITISMIDLSGMNLTGYNFRWVEFSRVNFEGCIFHQTNFNGGVINDCCFNGSGFFADNLSFTKINDSSFHNSSMRQVNFHWATIKHCDFQSTSFMICDFSHVVMDTVSLKCADIDVKKLLNEANTLDHITFEKPQQQQP